MSLITITSDFGSGGEKIAQEVAKELRFELFDDHKIHEIAASKGLSSDELDGLDEKAPNLFDQLFSTKPAKYMNILGSIVYDISSQGEGVIIGHGAQIFLRDFSCALHILIHASEKTRSEKLAQEQNLSIDKAVKLIHKMDKQVKNFIQYNFHRDWKDPSAYDLVFNLDNLGEVWATKLIVELAKSNEIKTCSEKAKQEMELASLKYRVEAVLVENNLKTSTVNTIIVEVPARGKVHLTGWISSDTEKERLIEVAKKVPEVSEVISDVYVMPASYED